MRPINFTSFYLTLVTHHKTIRFSHCQFYEIYFRVKIPEAHSLLQWRWDSFFYLRKIRIFFLLVQLTRNKSAFAWLESIYVCSAKKKKEFRETTKRRSTGWTMYLFENFLFLTIPKSGKKCFETGQIGPNHKPHQMCMNDFLFSNRMPIQV